MKLTRLCFIGMVCAGIVALGRLVKELRPLSLSLLVRMTACVALLWLFAPVAQADSPTVGASASYLVTTGAIGGGSNVDTDPGFKDAFASLSEFVHDSSGNGVFVTASAHADDSSAKIGAFATLNGAGNFLSATSNASALITDPTFKLGRLNPIVDHLEVLAIIDLHGATLASGEDPANFDFRPSPANGDVTAATVFASVNATQNGRFLGGVSTSGGENFPPQPTDHPPDEVMPLLLEGVVPNQPVVLVMNLQVRAKLNIATRCRLADCADDLTAGQVSSVFFNTLSWGGITSVIDERTGEPVDDWFVTSDTGFDYSKPSPVPEPSSIQLLAALVGTPLVGRRTHRGGRG